MRGEYNTSSVIGVNTPSVLRRVQTVDMPKSGKTTDFWKRLTLARTSCVPPKSMRQEDIRREYGYAHQSGVSKFSTGGTDGKSMPSPDVATRMALDANVNFNWLWAGQGDMRPLPATDPITKRVVEVLSALHDPEAKLKVLEAAIAQQVLQIPAVAQQYREAADEARRQAEQPPSSPTRRRAGTR